MHYTLPDSSEVVEEYDLQTDELLLRKKRGKTVLGAFQEWEFEVGEPPARTTIENETLRPNSSNPIFVRKDRPHAFEWRVRNLPYPKATYSVTIDKEQNQIVIRTANKKYFKRIDVEELERMRIPLEDGPLSWTHENNTLIVQYKKPAGVLAKEKEAKVARLTAPEQGPVSLDDPNAEQCKQQ